MDVESPANNPEETLFLSIIAPFISKDTLKPAVSESPLFSMVTVRWLETPENRGSLESWIGMRSGVGRVKNMSDKIDTPAIIAIIATKVFFIPPPLFCLLLIHTFSYILLSSL